MNEGWYEDIEIEEDDRLEKFCAAAGIDKTLSAVLDLLYAHKPTQLGNWCEFCEMKWPCSTVRGGK